MLSVKSKFQRDGDDDDLLLLESMAFPADLFRACFLPNAEEPGRYSLVVNVQFEVKPNVHVKTEV